MNMPAFAAAMVALSNARKEAATVGNIYGLNVDAKLMEMQVTLCEELIKELRGSAVGNKELTEGEKTLVKSGSYKNNGYNNTSWHVPNKVLAIKNVRERTALGLLEAKNLVEAYMKTQGML